MYVDERLTSYGILRNSVAPTGDLRTIVVLGVQFGGTSMVAQALHNLGVPMGNRENSPTFEDDDFFTLLSRADQIDEAEMCERFSELVEARNSLHSTWGWKTPGVVTPKLYRLLRNPMLVMVCRDPVAIASRGVASLQNDVAESTLKHASVVTDRLVDLFGKTELPCLLVSYEKAIAHPDVFCRELGTFIDLGADHKRLELAASFITPSPADYIEATNTAAPIGCLDGFKDGKVTGWLADQTDLDRELSVQIIIDHSHVFEAATNQRRRDVQKKLGGDGVYGFSFLVPDEFIDGAKHSVEIRSANNTVAHILSGSRMLLFER